MNCPKYNCVARVVAGCFIVWVIALLSQTTAQDAVPTPTVIFKGHTEAIYSATFSPDAALVATGSFDKSVKLWDAKTGKELRAFAGATAHQNLVLNVAFAPNGESLATGSSDNSARVWDIPVNTPVKEFVHAVGVSAVAVSADGKLVAGACKDGSIKLWTAVDGKPAGNLVGHPGGATGVAFSANGQILATCGADQMVRFWNPANGQALGAIGAHASGVNGVALNPNNVAAYSVGDDGFLKWWQLPVVAPRSLPPHADAITSFFLSADGNSVLTGGADKLVKLSNSVNGQLVKDFPGAGAALNAVATGGNPATVAAGGADGKLYLFNAADGKPIAQPVAHAGGVTGLAYHPAQPLLATVGADGTMKTWALPLPAPRSIVTPDRVLSSLLSADGKRLFTGGADKIVRSWTFATGALERQFPGHTGTVTALAVSADGNTLVSAGADETIRFWNVANAQQTALLSGHAGGITSLSMQGNTLVSAGEDGTVKIWQLPPVAAKPFAHPDAVNALTLSADGNRLLTIGNDKQVRIWLLTTGQMERAHTAGAGAITATTFAADNVTLAVAGADKSLVVYNAGKEVRKFPPLALPASAVAFSANGATVAAALGDNTIRLLTVAEPKDKKEVKEPILAGHTAAITALTYTPKGDLLISASADKTIRLWNAADGAAKGALTHTAPVAAMALSKDGTRVAAGGADKIVALWTLADNKPAGTITTPAEVRGISFSPDGLRVAVAGADNKVRIYGLDGKLQETFIHDGPATGVAFLPDGKRLISSSADKTARIWTGAFLAQGAHTGPVRQVFLTPQGDRVFSCGDDKEVRIIDPKTGKELRTLEIKTGKEPKAVTTHEGPVVGFALSTDLTKIVTAGADNSAKVWTVADGKVVATIALPGPAQAIALSPNAARVTAAFADPAVKVRAYDAVSGKELQAIADLTAPVRALSILADNRSVLIAGDDKNVAVSDIAVTSVLPVNAGGATGIVYHPQGAQALTAGKDKAVRLWDLAMGKEAKAFPALADPISSVTASRDFALVAATSGKVAKIWQIADAKEVATLAHPAEVIAFAFNADKTRVVTGATDNLARVWEVATGRLLQTFSHGAAVRGVGFHPAQPQVITASADKTIVVHTQSILRAIPASTMPLRAVTVTANGTHVVTAGDDKNVKAWNLGTGADERTFAGATGPVYAVAVSKNVQVLAAAGADKTIRVYTFADAKLLGSITAPAVVRGLAIHPTLPILSAVCDDKSVNAYNIAFTAGQPTPAEFGKPIQSFNHADAAAGAAFAEAGLLYTASADKTIKQWRIASDTAVRNFAHPNLVDSVAFDPTSKFLATGCHDGVLRTFDLEKNAPGKTMNAHTMPQANPIYAVAWTPDGKQIISASYDRSLKLWDANAGTLVREFKPFTEKTFERGHRDQVFTVAFTKDGQLMATGSSDRTIKLWKVADGTVVREFASTKIKQPMPPESPLAHPGWIYGVRFSPDDKYLISAGSAPKNQGYLAVWNVADGKMLYGQELPVGPIYSMALSKDGTQILLGCGPRDRQQPASDAIIVPMPVK
jgi:WD40 repeat protein